MPHLRYGFVKEHRVSDARVRVEFDDRDYVRSYWLAVLKPKTRQDKVWWMPDIDEHVACLLDEHAEDGVVLGALYSERDQPKEHDLDLFKVEFSDGGYFEYHRGSGNMALRAQGSFSIKAGGSAAIEASSVTIKGGSINLDAPRVIAKGSPVSRIGDKDNKGDVMVTGAG